MNFIPRRRFLACASALGSLGLFPKIAAAQSGEVPSCLIYDSERVGEWLLHISSTWTTVERNPDIAFPVSAPIYGDDFRLYERLPIPSENSNQTIKSADARQLSGKQILDLKFVYKHNLGQPQYALRVDRANQYILATDRSIRGTSGDVSREIAARKESQVYNGLWHGVEIRKGSYVERFNYNKFSRGGENQFNISEAAMMALTRGDAPIMVSLLFANQPYFSQSVPISGSYVKGLFNIGIPRFEDVKRQQKAGECRSGCFITTASCDGVGLDDNCWELQTLRKFRDGWMSQSAGMREEIDDYYSIAPLIVDRIHARGDANKIWQLVYTSYILPSAILIKLGLNKQAYRLYKIMVQDMIRLS